jgi:cytochrome c-type biogenesis protein
MIFDGTNINLIIAFTAGIITFFASCLLPLVPTYLAFLSGVATNTASDDASKKIYKRNIFTNGFFFTLGFILIFTLLGATANSLGSLFATNRELIQKIGGIFFIIMGLFMLDLIKPMALLKERKIELPKHLTKWNKLNALILGSTFGFAWTPCVGPVLGVILFWASQAASFWKGVGLLTAYGVGLGVPFLVVALLFESLAPKLKNTHKFGKALQLISGGVIILMGILLILNKVEYIALVLINIAGLRAFSV